MAGVAICGVIVAFGPRAAEALMPLLGPEPGLPAAETLFTLVIYGTLAAVALIAGALAGLTPASPGRSPLLRALIGFLVGMSGIAAAACYAWLAEAVRIPAGAPPTLMLLAWGSLAVLFAAAAEELFFRGWLQPVLVRRFGLPVAVVLTAAAFAGLHLMGGARSPISLVNLFLGGILFGLLAARGGGLAGPVAAHFGWNWTERILLGLDANPGVGSWGAIRDLDLVGPAIWGGSEEGLNASLAMSVALFAMLVPLALLMRARRRGPESNLANA